MRSVVAAWAQSAGSVPVYQVPLGQAAAYGLLSGGSIVARNAAGVPLPVQAVGSAGASGAIGPLVAATAGVFAQGNGTVPLALTDLQAAKTYCGQPRAQARGMAGQLAGRTLTHGVYTISSSATLSQSSTLTITGDTATVVIVNVAGDLTLEAGSRVALAGVLPRHVYWNVAGALHVAGHVAFMGNALVTGDALVDGVQLGYAAILSSGNVTLTNISASVGHNRFFAPRGTASYCDNPGPPCAFSPCGSELIMDGSFELYQCCPTGIGGLALYPSHPDSDACFWQSATGGGTADYFNDCSNSRSSTPVGSAPITYPTVGVPDNQFSTIATPDYLTATTRTTYKAYALDKNSRARTGHGYAGIHGYMPGLPEAYYEYLYQKINRHLQPNRRYYAEFSAHLAQTSDHVLTELGMLVEPANSGPSYPLANSQGRIPRTPTISGNPRYYHPKNSNPPAQNVPDSLNWQRVGGVFTATAAMVNTPNLRIVIGYFGDGNANQYKPDGPGTEHTAYYFIDNVSLSPLTEAGPDVVLGTGCTGSPGPASVTLGTDVMPDLIAATYLWTLPDGTQLANTPNLTVAPTQTTTYLLTVTINGQSYSSQATVTVNNVYAQNAAATYVAPAGIGPADLGLLGRIMTIDASAAPYRGRVVFDGTYHVRGTVHLVNGTFELRPGTTFLADGSSGLPYDANSGDTDLTTLVVQNASLELSGTTLRASCAGPQWGGVWLERQGIMRTQSGGAARSHVQDARTAVSSRVANEYYLTDTDFWHNDCGLRERATDKVASSGEGVQNCTFRDGLYGIVLEEGDYGQYGNLYGGDYDAASFAGNDFADLTYMGISAVAGRAHFSDNHFRDCGTAAISTQGNLPAGPPELRANHIVVPATSAALGGIVSISQNPLIQDNVIEGVPAPLKTTGNVRVGIDFLVSMESGNTDQVTGNTVRNLDMALTTTTNDYDGATITIKKNTFQNNAADLVFYPYGNVNHPFPSSPPVTATIRCNSFLNDVYSTVADPIGIWLKDMAVIDQGLAFSGNGNEFPSNDWFYALGNHRPLVNDNQAGSLNTLDYAYFFYSSNEKVSFSGTGTTNLIKDYSSATNACGGTTPGVNNRQYSPLVAGAAGLNTKLDSLRRDGLTVVQQTRLLKIIRSQPAQAAQLAALEELLSTNTLAPSSQLAVGLHLLQFYRAQHDAPNATRLRSWLRSHTLADKELQSYLSLTRVTDQIGGFLPGLCPLTAVNRNLLSEVAISGTTSALLACRLLRAYEPTCTCVLVPDAPRAVRAASTLLQVEKGAMGLSLTAYPNPANTVLHIPYALPDGIVEAEIRAYDALGRAVLHQSLTGLQGEAEVNVQRWSTGLYQFTLITGEHVLGQQRIVITH